MTLGQEVIVLFLLNQNSNTLYSLKCQTSLSQQQHKSFWENFDKNQHKSRDILIFNNLNKIRTIATKLVNCQMRQKNWKRKKAYLDCKLLEWRIEWNINLNKAKIVILWTFIPFTIKKKKTNVFVVYKEIRVLRNRRFYRTVKLNLIWNLKIPNISKNTETISIT